MTRVILPGFYLFTSVAILNASSASAQGTPEDYERSERLLQRTRNKVFQTSVNPYWSEDGNHFWYCNNLLGGEFEYVWVNAVKGARAPAFDHEKLAKALSARWKEDVSAKRILVGQIAIDASANEMRFNAAGKRYVCKLTDYTLSEAGKPEPLSSLTPLPRIQPTRRNGGETTLLFVNQRQDEIELFWTRFGSKASKLRHHRGRQREGNAHVRRPRLAGRRQGQKAARCLRSG